MSGQVLLDLVRLVPCVKTMFKITSVIVIVSNKSVNLAECKNQIVRRDPLREGTG